MSVIVQVSPYTPGLGQPTVGVFRNLDTNIDRLYPIVGLARCPDGKVQYLFSDGGEMPFLAEELEGSSEFRGVTRDYNAERQEFYRKLVLAVAASRDPVEDTAEDVGRSAKRILEYLMETGAIE